MYKGYELCALLLNNRTITINRNLTLAQTLTLTFALTIFLTFEECAWSQSPLDMGADNWLLFRDLQHDTQVDGAHSNGVPWVLNLILILILILIKTRILTFTLIPVPSATPSTICSKRFITVISAYN